MAKPGPKPKPTALKLLSGVTRPDRLNLDEPVPSPNPPAPPEWLSAAALAVWDRLVAELETMGVLTSADTELYALFASTAAFYADAVRLVDTTGQLIRGRDGGVVKNPAAQLVRDNGSLLARLSADLGLSPSSRSRVERVDMLPAEGGRLDPARLLS